MTRYQLETCVRLGELGWGKSPAEQVALDSTTPIGGPVEMLPPHTTEVWVVKPDGSVVPKKFRFEA